VVDDWHWDDVADVLTAGQALEGDAHLQHTTAAPLSASYNLSKLKAVQICLCGQALEGNAHLQHATASFNEGKTG
jgi:hypothetical protein